jgi:hypothetical protein
MASSSSSSSSSSRALASPSAATARRADALEAILSAASCAAPGSSVEAAAAAAAAAASAAAAADERARERVARTGKAEDGSLQVFTRVEMRFPSGDLYVGETLGGKKAGRGSYYFHNGDVYVGEFQNDVFHGFGSLKKAPFRENGRQCAGRAYQGSFQAGLRHGRGRQSTGFNDTFEGDFEQDAYHGQGIMLYANGDKYEGSWRHGKRHGEGLLTFAAGGGMYKGHFQANEYHGEGILAYGPGRGSYSGTWRQGKKHGIGKRVYSSGAEYEGEFVEDALCGKGVYKSALGDLYCGDFKDDKFHGEGTLIKCCGDRYQGQLVRGQPAGVGRYEWEAGGFYEGEFNSMVRCGVPYNSIDRWYWKSYAFNPRTHIYDPITGALLTVRGKKVLPGQAVEVEQLDFGKTSSKQRLAQAMAEKTERNLKAAAERHAYEHLIEELSGAKREQAMQRFAAKHGAKVEDFVAPVVVGTARDQAYLKAGGRADKVVPAADGKRCGKGVRVWADGARYEGDWFEDLQQGFGVYVGPGYTGVRYEGEWLEGKRHGNGVQSYGHTLGGQFICPLGYKHEGEARCFFDGTWAEDLFEGEGTFTCCDGRQYHGDWQRGKRHGHGRLVMVPAKMQYAAMRGIGGQLQLQGVVETGEHGMVVEPDHKDRVYVYEGNFNKNKREGLARQTLAGGDVMEGMFKLTKPHGIMKVTFTTGKVRRTRGLQCVCVCVCVCVCERVFSLCLSLSSHQLSPSPPSPPSLLSSPSNPLLSTSMATERAGSMAKTWRCSRRPGRLR